MNSLLKATLEVFDQSWIERSDRKGWHAYGVRAEGHQLRAALFVQTRFNVGPLIQQLKTQLQRRFVGPIPPDLFEVVRMGLFQGMRTGSQFRRSVARRPGARVFTTSALCGRGCFGTIGGFLKKENGSAADPVWLVSNHHILAEHEECAAGTEIRGAGGSLLSNEVKFVPLKKVATNDADVAVARISDLTNLAATYPGISIVCPHPLAAQYKMPVQKLGNATSVTAGTFLWCCPKVVTVSCSGRLFEFQNQLIISSIPKKKPFLAHGDSGSLVVGGQHPVALLFAIGSKAILPEEIRTTATAPLGLATPFGIVLRELNSKTDIGTVQLILDSALAPCSFHTNTDPGICSAYLDEILVDIDEQSKTQSTEHIKAGSLHMP